eukprot:810362-Prorocentrum_minimum.AAC.3
MHHTLLEQVQDGVMAVREIGRMQRDQARGDVLVPRGLPADVPSGLQARDSVRERVQKVGLPGGQPPILLKVEHQRKHIRIVVVVVCSGRAVYRSRARAELQLDRAIVNPKRCQVFQREGTFLLWNGS